jgi:hypothetical protein
MGARLPLIVRLVRLYGQTRDSIHGDRPLASARVRSCTREMTAQLWLWLWLWQSTMDSIFFIRRFRHTALKGMRSPYGSFTRALLEVGVDGDTH